MASLGNALVSKILGHSAAEKAFRPWWDNMEDFLVYGLVILGLVVAPTAIINGTPLDCNFCQEDHCLGKTFSNAKSPEEIGRGNVTQKDPGFNAWWVKKYCTMSAVDEFILYFPYILLIMALIIVLIERVFIRIFKAGVKLDMFYNLLVKETLEQSDAKPEQTPLVDTVDFGRSNSILDVGLDLENSKTAIQVSQSFAQSSNYFMSYLLRTFLELALAIVLLVWLILLGFPGISKEEFIYCQVHGYKYECAGHPQQFYIYVLFVTIFILGLYIACCFYNLIWLMFPPLGVLSRLMKNYRQIKRKKAKEILTDADLLGDLYTVYYTNRDLKLLLDLLAESSGVAMSIRILSLFDKEFRMQSQPFDVQVNQVDNNVIVSFDEASTVREVFGKLSSVVCLYTVEIFPPTSGNNVIAFKAQGDKNKTKVMKVNVDGDTELQPLDRSNLKKAEFHNLDPNREYKIQVCTLLNGMAIARYVHFIKP